MTHARTLPAPPPVTDVQLQEKIQEANNAIDGLVEAEKLAQADWLEKIRAHKKAQGVVLGKLPYKTGQTYTERLAIAASDERVERAWEAEDVAHVAYDYVINLSRAAAKRLSGCQTQARLLLASLGTDHSYGGYPE